MAFQIEPTGYEMPERTQAGNRSRVISKHSTRWP